jgi:restriction system protein
LRRCFTNRQLIDPWKLEDVVASVYRGLGFHARVTGRTRDGGIDVVLDGDNGETIGVQVKRYKDTVRVDQIRAFVGALVEGHFTKGIFITTSAFTKGAPQCTAKVAERGIAIELLDSDRFYAALDISQQNVFDHLTDPNYRMDMCPLTETTPDSWEWDM